MLRSPRQRCRMRQQRLPRMAPQPLQRPTLLAVRRTGFQAIGTGRFEIGMSVRSHARQSRRSCAVRCGLELSSRKNRPTQHRNCRISRPAQAVQLCQSTWRRQQQCSLAVVACRVATHGVSSKSTTARVLAHRSIPQGSNQKFSTVPRRVKTKPVLTPIGTWVGMKKIGRRKPIHARRRANRGNRYPLAVQTTRRLHPATLRAGACLA